MEIDGNREKSLKIAEKHKKSLINVARARVRARVRAYTRVRERARARVRACARARVRSPALKIIGWVVEWGPRGKAIYTNSRSTAPAATMLIIISIFTRVFFLLHVGHMARMEGEF